MNLEHLIRSYLLSRSARRVCRSYYGVDPIDAWGELYCRLSKLANLKQIQNPEAWVRVNGRGILQTWLKREFGCNRRNVPIDELGTQFGQAQVLRSNDREPIEELLESELSENVANCLRSLPRRDRRLIFALSKNSRESLRDIAKERKLSPQTVCNRANEVIQKLRSMLEQHK